MPVYCYHLNVILLFCSARISACFLIATVNQEKDACTQPFKIKDPHLKHDLVLPQKVKLEPAALAQQRSATHILHQPNWGAISRKTQWWQNYFFVPWHDKDAFPKVILTLHTQCRHQQHSHVSLFKSHEPIIYQSVQYCSVQHISVYYRTNFPESLMRKELSTLLLHNILEIKYNST